MGWDGCVTRREEQGGDVEGDENGMHYRPDDLGRDVLDDDIIYVLLLIKS